MTLSARLKFVELGAGKGSLATLSLARPEAANAFNADLINDLTAHLYAVAANGNCRALIINAEGKHFSAGADLAWMQASAKLSPEDNRKDTGLLTQLFESVAKLDIPTVAAVNGAAYGGAVGLVAACDIAVASTDARFCLSEVKLGLAPAVILPYLMRKMRPDQLARAALTARVFNADDALAYGLVQRTAAPADLTAAVADEVNLLLGASPVAHAELKRLWRTVRDDGLRQSAATVDTIARLRTGPAGQSGLKAFFAKEPPPWTAKVDAKDINPRSPS